MMAWGAAAVLLAGCPRLVVDEPVPDAAVDGAVQVPLVVVQGPDGSALAFVPVYIEGQGPYSFALDTGASRSLIHADVVEQLRLPQQDEAVEVTGVTEAAEANVLQVENWRLGDVEFPSHAFLTLEMPAPAHESPMQGLLGSDILSRFHQVTIDYRSQVLTLGPRQ